MRNSTRDSELQEPARARVSVSDGDPFRGVLPDLRVHNFLETGNIDWANYGVRPCEGPGLSLHARSFPVKSFPRPPAPLFILMTTNSEETGYPLCVWVWWAELVDPGCSNIACSLLSRRLGFGFRTPNLFTHKTLNSAGLRPLNFQLRT